MYVCFGARSGPEVTTVIDSSSNRNKYQEYFLEVKVASAWGW